MSTSPPRIERRIFIVGAPRSGTTLLQSLLASHSHLTSFTESHFFDRHFAPLPWGGSLLTRNPVPGLRGFLEENGAEPPPAAEELASDLAGAGGWKPLLPWRTLAVARRLLAVLDELAAGRGHTGWVEKTPRHLHHLRLLERATGTDSRVDFVHLVREGLEVVASLHRASQSWERAYDLDTCARRWNEDLRRSRARLGRSHDHFVAYEQLTTATEPVLRRLLERLDLPWEPEILDRYSASAERWVGRGESWKEGVGRPIERSASSSRVLTGEQRERVRRALQEAPYEEIAAAAGFATETR